MEFLQERFSRVKDVYSNYRSAFPQRTLLDLAEPVPYLVQLLDLAKSVLLPAR